MTGLEPAPSLVANEALSQLSYIPKQMVGLSGFEPETSRLSGVRSNQLSYRPEKKIFRLFPFSLSTP